MLQCWLSSWGLADPVHRNISGGGAEKSLLCEYFRPIKASAAIGVNTEILHEQ